MDCAAAKKKKSSYHKGAALTPKQLKQNRCPVSRQEAGRTHQPLHLDLGKQDKIGGAEAKKNIEGKTGGAAGAVVFELVLVGSRP